MNELIDFIKQWQSNPLHWTNNKRRMHGYAPLRKSLNSKKRFYLDKFILFSLVQDAIAKEMPDLINKQIEQLTNIKNWKSTNRFDFSFNLWYNIYIWKEIKYF